MLSTDFGWNWFKCLRFYNIAVTAYFGFFFKNLTGYLITQGERTGIFTTYKTYGVKNEAIQCIDIR